MNFIDNVDTWIDKFTAEKLITYINQYLNKYKYMEANIHRHNDGVKTKIPDNLSRARGIHTAYENRDLYDDRQ